MATLTPLQEAVSDATDPVRLAQLATHQDADVRKAARANPRCPAAALQLIELAENRPTYLVTEHLKVLAHLGPTAQVIAAQHPWTPNDVLIHLVMSGHTKVVLAHRKDRSADWLLVQGQQTPGLLQYLANNRSVPWFVRRRAWAMLKEGAPASVSTPQASAPSASPPTAQATPAPGATAAAPVAPPTTEDVRAKLRNRKEPFELSREESLLIENDRKLQRLAARHPQTPVPLLMWLDQHAPYGQAKETLLKRLEEDPIDAETLTRVARQGEWEMRAAVARNPHLPDPARAQLSEDEDWWVRAAVAENPSASPAELTRLAGDQEHITIKEHVAAHPNTPGDVLVTLADDGDPAVRAQVARNPSTPPEALARLATDERFATREAVAAHGLTSLDILQQLTADANERVNVVARLRTQVITADRAQEALSTRRRHVKLALANTQGTPPTVLEKLAADRNPLIRAQAALHSELPDLARKALVKDTSPSVSLIAKALDEETPADLLAFLPRHDARVRQALSRNEHAPAPVLEELSDDPLHDVRLSVVLNPGAPGAALERRLPEQPLRPDIRRHPRYAGAVQKKLHDLELQEAKNPDASPESLSALSLSDFPRVRKAVAAHFNTAPDTLLQLVSDSEEQIREAIVQREGSTHGELPAFIQHQLAKDASVTVRQLLAKRPDLDVSTMLMLANTPNEDEDVLELIVGHTNVTPEVLAELGRHTKAALRLLVARHACTPMPTLQQLARDMQEEVQMGVFKNPSRTPEVLMILLSNPRLRVRVARDRRANGKILESLAYDPAYARYLRMRAIVNRTPLRDKRPIKRWKAWMESRTSRRAFAELNVLSAVIEHPAATNRAVAFAMRLRHPDIDAAIQMRRAGAGAPPAQSPLQEEDDE